MYKKKKIIAIIPARGGSKGLLNKNIKKISEKPLIYWTLKRVKESKLIDKYFISTDSIRIKNVCEKIGFDIPILRPSEFAEDDSPSSDVVIHALDYFKKLSLKFDYVVLLEPTSPLRKPDDIDNAIKKLIDDQNSDTLVSLGEVHMEHPSITKKIKTKERHISSYVEEEKVFFQRQQFQKAYFPYGVVYIAKTNYFRNLKTFYSEKTLPFFIERWQNYEIDDQIDFDINELLIKKYL
jgi:CMP-N,N'-diacetyllegionaminic acid synthase